MKINNISHGIAELAGRKLEIDLENLCITFDKDYFNLTKIPGTKGYMFDAFPARPKFMKRQRYYKHYQRFVNYTRKGDSLWMNGLNN